MGYNIGESQCVNHTHNTTTTCTFILVNGSVLTIIGIVGFILSVATIYCLIYHVKLPLCQNIFILNVAICDVLHAVIGTIRGLGILSPMFVGLGDDGEPNGWCYAYNIMGNCVWNAGILVLVPLTIDRFVAIVFPLRYRSLITKQSSKIMSALTWLPLLGLILFDSITFGEGFTKIVYQERFHRCIIENNRRMEPIVYLLLPFLAIIAMYFTMVFFLKRTGIKSKKLLAFATAIIVTGFITVIPDHLLEVVKVKLSYEVAQIVTVTLFYTNSICNPIIYFCTNPTTHDDLAATPVGRRLSRMASSTAAPFVFTSDSEQGGGSPMPAIHEHSQ